MHDKGGRMEVNREGKEVKRIREIRIGDGKMLKQGRNEVML